MGKNFMRPGEISRLMQIITSLQAGKTYSATKLSKTFGTSRRTIFRDMKELRVIGVPYHYDAKTGCYTIQPEFFLPPFDLNLREALNLLLLALKLSEQIQLPSPKSILLAALKIENNLPPKIRQYCNEALRNISVTAKPKAKIKSLDKTFAQLLVSVQNNRFVKIRYYLPNERKDIAIDLEPYHLMYNDNTWYVLGKSNLHKDIQAFKLNRIKELTTSDKCFVEEEKFDIQEYLGRAWSMVPEGRLYNIKLRFMPEVAYDVAAVQWHRTQTVTFEDDGSAIIEFRVDGLSEITWWILSYGERVQVLAPRILQQKVIEIAQNVVKSTPR